MKEFVVDTVALAKAEEFKNLHTLKFTTKQKVFIGLVFSGLFIFSAALFGYNLTRALVVHQELLDRKAFGIITGRPRNVYVYNTLSQYDDYDEELFAPLNALSDEFIDDVNSMTDAWEAGRNFAEDTPMEYIKKLMGVKKDESMKALAKLLNTHRPTLVGGQDLPTEFDARTEWPDCTSISEISDQGGCGSCWAFGATETMTDRQCIHKNETFHYSAEDLVSCCDTCGDGCDGGYPMNAFVHWKTDGIVSGGDYSSYQGCSPYQVEPCEHHVSGNRSSCTADTATPACWKECDASYNSTYDEDLHFAETVYALSNEEEILRELVENGPLEAAFDVYEDFLHYKSGVYHHVTGSSLGGHAIRVIGFGVEGGVPYYLCANSWNYDWGNGGFFKIRRDQMDADMVTGIPA